MSTKELLLGQVSAYIILAQNLNSVYYWKRVRETLQLLKGIK